MGELICSSMRPKAVELFKSKKPRTGFGNDLANYLHTKETRLGSGQW